MKCLLSLFDATLIWAEPYLNSGWCVCQIDKMFSDDLFWSNDPTLGKDVLDIDTDLMYEYIFDNSPTGTVDGILAAVPCTHIAGSGAQFWKAKDDDGRTNVAKEIVLQTLRIIDLCQPDFWVIENPVGRMNTLVPEMKQYGPKYFQPWWYGDPYTKKTGLWGLFNMPTKLPNTVEPPKSPTKESSVDRYWRVDQGVSITIKNRQYLRSITPEGFSREFYKANH